MKVPPVSDLDLRRGSFMEVVPDIHDGEAIHRLMFCFLARGCAHAFHGSGPCRMCAFPDSSAMDFPVTAKDLIVQFDDLLDRVDFKAEGIRQVDIFCAGSFFNDDEIPASVRKEVLERLGSMGFIKRVLVESRPEYITQECLASALEALGDKVRLEVALGLESANDHIREEVIRKGFGRADFEKSLAILSEFPVNVLVYLLIKPPTLSEKEALEDAVASGEWVFQLAARYGLSVTAAFQPVFVQKGTWVDQLYQEGSFRPPWIWTVLEVIRRLHGQGELQIGSVSDEPPPYAVRGNCGECDERCEKAIEAYNRTLDSKHLDVALCKCHKDWEKLVKS